MNTVHHLTALRRGLSALTLVVGSLALTGGLAAPVPAQADFYTWIDDDGARVISDEPPEHGDYEDVPGPSSTRGNTATGGDDGWSPTEIFVFEGPDGERLVTNLRNQGPGMELIAQYGRPPARARCGRNAQRAMASGGGEYADIIHDAAGREGVDPELVLSVIHVESCFDPEAVSRVGAHGLMQLMPATAAELGVTDRFDPVQNIHGGVRYLAAMLQRFDGDLDLALAAYNAGPGAVERHGGVPPYEETREYIRRIGRHYNGDQPLVRAGSG